MKLSCMCIDAGVGILDIAFGIPGIENRGCAIELFGRTVLPSVATL